ncbi:TPA: hypothetical protein VA268_001343 [Streptococcus agalactiae]|nr:hypothetical protein [Streptococcus agalactiae]
MATYQEYKSRSNGNAYDIDGSFAAQCWDGYADYCKYLGLCHTQTVQIQDTQGIYGSNVTKMVS